MLVYTLILKTMQTFFINKGSVLPTLRMHLIENTNLQYYKMHEAIQDADIHFTMVDAMNGVTRVSAEGYAELSERSGCEEIYDVCYDWKKRDTMIPGSYIGRFDIVFNGDIHSDDYAYPKGNLIMPIREDLQIVIK